jgi:CDP-diacylglycerol---serine O-phosphatidyltransferase
MSYMREEDGLDRSILLFMPAFIYSCAAAYRLAKFNLDDSQAYGFKGLPTPAAGLLIASFPLILHFGNGLININDLLINKWVLYGLIVFLSWIMVSNIPLMALKFKDFKPKNNLPVLMLAGIGLVAVIALHWLAVPIIFIAYIILSLALKNKATS